MDDASYVIPKGSPPRTSPKRTRPLQSDVHPVPVSINCLFDDFESRRSFRFDAFHFPKHKWREISPRVPDLLPGVKGGMLLSDPGAELKSVDFFSSIRPTHTFATRRHRLASYPITGVCIVIRIT